MTGATTITCSTASGKSLQELSRLIALRAERLGELTKDAVIATAIDVLVSLRAGTLDARKERIVDKPRRLTVRSDLRVSFRGTTRAPCLRHVSDGSEYRGGSLYFVRKGARAKDLTVFELEPCHERIRPYFVAAYNAEDATKVEAQFIRRRIERKGGLAKTALGVAMAKISTRNVDSNSPKIARILASNLSHITVTGSGYGEGSFGLEYRDDLNYAMDALKSGPAGLDTAMQKAANKIAGLINHTAHQAGDLEHDIPTPFPDIKRR